jgi:hypothetical protein
MESLVVIPLVFVAVCLFHLIRAFVLLFKRI